jgi:hypothetical protein
MASALTAGGDGLPDIRAGSGRWFPPGSFGFHGEPPASCGGLAVRSGRASGPANAAAMVSRCLRRGILDDDNADPNTFNGANAPDKGVRRRVDLQAVTDVNNMLLKILATPEG